MVAGRLISLDGSNIDEEPKLTAGSSSGAGSGWTGCSADGRGAVVATTRLPASSSAPSSSAAGGRRWPLAVTLSHSQPPSDVVGRVLNSKEAPGRTGID